MVAGTGGGSGVSDYVCWQESDVHGTFETMKDYTLHMDPLQHFPSIAKTCQAAGGAGQRLKFHIGLDVESAGAAVCVIVDGGNPRDLGKASREVIRNLVTRLVALGHHVAVCQEACGFGPYLHRALAESGAASYLIAPTNLTGNRKTDRADARELAQRVHSYDQLGNTKALRIVRDLGEAARKRRALGRHRALVQKSRNQLAGNGFALLLEFGFHEVPDGWWGRRKWVKLRATIAAGKDPWILALLDPLVISIHQLHDRCRELEAALAEGRSDQPPETNTGRGAARVAPKGVGDLTMDLIESEVGDWNRFRNRGQVGSYTGLCSSERSTAGSRRQGSIDRQGNGRIRTQLVEAVWRLQQWNPGWRAFRKFPHVFGEKGACGPAARKKAVVACARMLMVDLWRLNTGQTTLERLGLTA